MDKEAFLNLFKSKSAGDYSAAGDTTLSKPEKPAEKKVFEKRHSQIQKTVAPKKEIAHHSPNKNHLHEDKHHGLVDDKKDQAPFTNDDLHEYINYLGFKADEVPQFSKMAKLLNKNIEHEDVEKDLTNLDNHDTIKDVTFNKDQKTISREALKRLISKYNKE